MSVSMTPLSTQRSTARCEVQHAASHYGKPVLVAAPALRPFRQLGHGQRSTVCRGFFGNLFGG